MEYQKDMTEKWVRTARLSVRDALEAERQERQEKRGCAREVTPLRVGVQIITRRKES